MGVPILTFTELLETVARETGKNEEFEFKFFYDVQKMYREGNWPQLRNEKVAKKLLRLCAEAQEGFIITDYPRNKSEAELMEEYRGGMNAFVHVSLPDEILVDIEESKLKCHDCGRHYYKDSIISEEHGVRIESFLPKDGHCDDCGSTNIGPASDPAAFERDLEIYHQ